MSDIERSHTGTRMSQIVKHGDTIYLAGQVGTAGASVAQQTQDCLDKIDALLAEAGSDNTRILQCVIWLADMAISKNERCLGCLGSRRPCTRARLRRGKTGPPRPAG